MAKLKLTWQKTSNRWCKVFRGRKYYLGYGKNKSDATSYRIALEEWEKKRLELDAEKPNGEEYKRAIELRQEMIKFCEMEGFADNPNELTSPNREKLFPDPNAPKEYDVLTLRQWHDKLIKEVQWLTTNLARNNPPRLGLRTTPIQLDPLYGTRALEKIYWGERIDHLDAHERWTGTTDKEKTIGANVDAYIKLMIGKAHAGQISKSHASKLKEAMDIFKQYAGELSVETFNGREFEGFYEQVIKRTGKGKGKWSQAYARGIMTYTKMFIRWAWRKEILANLPRNLAELTIKIDPKRPDTLDIENEIKPLLVGATGRTKLFLLLMLNTGMTQIDISELKPEDVNWEEGRIIRKRTKTANNENVPVVNYLLFRETFSLLKQYGQRKGERVFLNENENPLVIIDMKEDGTQKRIDTIRLAYSRLCLRLKVPCRPLKLLRNTSATLLYNKEEYRDLYDILLDHAPKGIGQKHYADAGKGILDKAITYLGQKYGIK